MSGILHLADRLAADPFFVAGHASTSALVTALGCCELTAAWVRLCRYPRGAGDLLQVAERFGIDPVRLGDALATE